MPRTAGNNRPLETKATPILSASLADVTAVLRTNTKTGLAATEAEARFGIHGPNELPHAKPPGPGHVLGRQFKDLMIWVLVVAIVLSVFLGHQIEAVAIGVIACFTVGLGFAQEWRAERALDALRLLSAPRANVLRDGVSVSIETRAVVPGDMLLLAQGDIVAADARLVEAVELQVAEASLTGESVPVAKVANHPMKDDDALGDRLAMVHASTVVTYGRARAVVTATGPDTELGKIGSMLARVKPEATPLQRQLARLARGLLMAGAVAVAAVVGLGIARDEPLLEMLLFGVAVAVAVVPEALPAVVTISLSIGAQRMAKRNALIRRLPTVETLGSTTVICSDKTGTLTMGQMAVTALHTPRGAYEVEATGYRPTGNVDPAPGEDVQELARAGALCNDASLQENAGNWTIRGDPTEAALIVLARKTNLALSTDDLARHNEIPFSSERKRMTTVHRVGDHLTAYCKGAPETVLGLCALVDGAPLTDRRSWLAEADRMAQRGLRVLALARKVLHGTGAIESDMELLGLVGIQDAPRPEVRQAIQRCREAGIRPVMITGDHALTASAVARDLGILTDGQTMTGAQLEEMGRDELAAQVGQVQVYARVSPAHKLRIVEAWQSQGHIVAMTGDGVNDAPALRKADIGVAMGVTGTDVAKEASGMMLADDNFATIVAAVEEGRGIFENIRKYLTYLLSTNFGEILLIAIVLSLGMPLPLTAVQILYVNLASDGLPALALAVDPHGPNAMKRPPRQPGKGILSPAITGLMIAGGLASAIVNVSVFAWALVVGKPVSEAMTMVFVSLILIELVKAYAFRSLDRPIWRDPFGNKWLNLACAWELVLLGLLIYVPFFEDLFGTRPMPVMDWAVILTGVIIALSALEAVKFLLRRRLQA